MTARKAPKISENLTDKDCNKQMSRLDNALDAIEKAVGELASAIQDHETSKAQASDSVMPQNGVDAQNGVDDGELRAMKSELHEAMSLLHAMQDVPQKTEGQ